ncbi:dicarboxylate/amino acid:cation symporter [Anaerocolumna sp. AGMB13020]|uniref:dicarboxylate/amino acid:cation symporter n=1 Tax=Anaerocolumna sp. AGMB13020 TaxID=3081750 RepID=UPI0029537993|nr:dicarboxylate/amino acid:cation symporter [Anaerocolumna sp. AGMB13020]WOO35908.1 dicarboxylate/amino acid:cation symporter [Anaerocolumna sp. AGMB13020]
MNIDWLSAAALAVVFVLFIIIYKLQKKKVNFTAIILGSLVAGIIIGIIFSGHTSWVMPIGKIYVSTLTAIVSPLIIISILSSITSLGSTAQLKGIGLRSIVWLLTTTLLAILLSLGLGLTFGIGRNSYLSLEGIDAQNFKSKVVPFTQVLIGFFPRNVVSDIAEENTIPMILFAVLIAVSYVLVANKNREKVAIFKSFVEAVKEIIFKAVDFIISLTPYAVLALIATATGNGVSRSGIMWSLLVLLIVSFLAFALDTWVINAVLLKAFAKLSPLKFFRKILPAQVVGFSTQSSAGTLPISTGILVKKIGIDPQVANFTAPLGTTIGMPGCAGIWPVLVAIYGINGLGINYEVKDYILLAIVSLFVSLGTAGVPGTATITTASVLTALGLPLELIVLSIPISAIADTGRTATNITGAMVASAIVGRQEHGINDNIFNDVDIYEAEDSTEPKEEAAISDTEPDNGIPIGAGCRL